MAFFTVLTLVSIALGSANTAHQLFPEHRPFIIERGDDGKIIHKFVPDPPYFSEAYKKHKEKQKYGYPNLKDLSKPREVKPESKKPLVPGPTDLFFKQRPIPKSDELPPPPPIKSGKYTKKPFESQGPLFAKPRPTPSIQSNALQKPVEVTLTHSSHATEIALIAIGIMATLGAMFFLIRKKL